MIETSIVEQARQWGYVLLAPHHPHCPGHAGLVFALHEKPKGAFFEPESVELWLRDDEGLIDQTRLNHIPQPRAQRQMCPGRVVLHDRLGGRAHFLAFGGSLSLVMGDDPQVYALRSSAPILELGDPTEPNVRQLAIEVEASFSRMRARWRGDDEGFLSQLAQVDPLALYVATLHSLIGHLEESEALQEQSPELYTILQRERRWLRKLGRWPTPEITLEQILEPGPSAPHELPGRAPARPTPPGPVATGKS